MFLKDYQGSSSQHINLLYVFIILGSTSDEERSGLAFLCSFCEQNKSAKSISKVWIYELTGEQQAEIQIFFFHIHQYTSVALHLIAKLPNKSMSIDQKITELVRIDHMRFKG